MTKKQVDVFISYASEDALIAEQLAGALESLGLNVWQDRIVLKIGSSLRRSIDEGLAVCTYGVVLLSPSFLVKSWPQRELDGLVAREMGEGRPIILPVWHKISQEEVRQYSPPLADKLALQTSEGIRNVAIEIASIFSPVSDSQKRLIDLSSERGFWYKSIDFSAHIMEENTRWQLLWEARIVSDTDYLEGISISYRIDDLLRGSLVDYVREDGIRVEQMVAAHPRAIQRFFRLPMPIEKGEETTITYFREFRKIPPAQPSDLFVSKVALRCDLMILRVTFDQAPAQLLYRVTDRGESQVVADEQLYLTNERPYTQRILSPPNRTLTYGFYWSYVDESQLSV